MKSMSICDVGFFILAARMECIESARCGCPAKIMMIMMVMMVRIQLRCHVEAGPALRRFCRTRAQELQIIDGGMCITSFCVTLGTEQSRKR